MRSGWHTLRVIRVEQHRAARTGTRKVLARWLLLAAVIGAVLALHVLTAEDHPANSGQFAVAGTEQLLSVPDHPGEVSEPAGPQGAAPWLAGCMLFLTAAAPGALALLLVLQRRRRPTNPTAGAGVGDRGSTGWVVPVLLPPRLAAGVDPGLTGASTGLARRPGSLRACLLQLSH